ncbi:hypothetical protein GCM10012284_27410 [Mangrovihabitans endophyticus]|uniref:Uncharacterized protein n=1 Tax=Mangrovihabitans endophyticus TaxID=1751298 RepID=A0A8J3FNE3_9ACTN|nr:hypothetical protein GCM10012284_27410 [Mangrovihabitans endophyticus]
MHTVSATRPPYGVPTDDCGSPAGPPSRWACPHTPPPGPPEPRGCPKHSAAPFRPPSRSPRLPAGTQPCLANVMPVLQQPPATALPLGTATSDGPPPGSESTGDWRYPQARIVVRHRRRRCANLGDVSFRAQIPPSLRTGPFRGSDAVAQGTLTPVDAPRRLVASAVS